MIKGALKTLKREKEIAIKKIHSMNGVSIDEYFKKIGAKKLIGRPINQKRLKEVALYEIEINCVSAEQYLNRLKSEHFDINDDLTRIEELYDADYSYRSLVNRLQAHFFSMKDIPEKLEAKEYYPSYPITHLNLENLIVSDE